MPGINAKLTPIISRTKSSPPDARAAARAIRNSRLPNAEAIAGGFDNLTAGIEAIYRDLRQNAPEIHSFIVTDGTTGQVLAALGEYEVNGVKTSGGYFSELHAGDPFGNSDPSEAIFNVTPDGKVQIGQNGWVDVLDPFGADAAWIGTQFDTLDVTGAASNGAGLIRLAVTAHTLATGDDVRVFNVGGVPNATGIFTVTVVDANHIDLQNSVWTGTYTSGGTVTRVLHVTGIANNGSGKIRVTTAVDHLYESGDRVSLAGCGNADGQWTVTVADNTHFDLNDSVFASGYTNGTATRYFAGGNFQTIAIGPSFEDYRLRAFADGSLKIKNATITLQTPTGLIVLDPSVPEIYAIAYDPGTGDPYSEAFITGSAFDIGGLNSDGTPTGQDVSLTATTIALSNNGTSQFLVSLDLSGDTSTTTIVGELRALDTAGHIVVEMGQGPDGFLNLSDTTNTVRVALDGGSGNISLTGTGGSITLSGSIGNISISGSSGSISLSGAAGTGTFSGPGGTVSILFGGISATGLIDAGSYAAGGINGVDTSFDAINTGGLSVTTGAAVTGVSGPGVSSVTTGTFVTGVTIPVTTHAVNKGLVTS